MELSNLVFDLTTKSFISPVPEENIDLGSVFPRITTLHHGLGNDLHIVEPIAPGLGVSYGLDMGNMFMLLQQKHLSAAITLETLREAALINLDSEVDGKNELRGKPEELLMLTNGGNYETAMILLDYFWEEIEEIMDDEVCIALPAKDLLFIAGKNNEKGREKLREMVRKFFDNPDLKGKLVRHIYTRENGLWVIAETA